MQLICIHFPFIPAIPLEAQAASLTERLEQSEAQRTSAEQVLAEQLNQLHGKELELVQLQTRLTGQKELLSLMKEAYQAFQGDKIREEELTVSGELLDVSGGTQADLSAIRRLRKPLKS